MKKWLFLIIAGVMLIACDPQEKPNSPDGTMGTFTDARDRNVYETVKIGDQIWMVENLKFLPKVTEPPQEGAEISDAEDPCYYVYGYNGTDTEVAKARDNYQTYGVLYNWLAAMKLTELDETLRVGTKAVDNGPIQGICPEGWHLPTDMEWKKLEMYLGMSQEEADEERWRGTNEGGKLKATTHWSEPNKGATNETEFTALPGGYMYYFGEFEHLGEMGFWWSATKHGTQRAWIRNLTKDEAKIGRKDRILSEAASVRCVKN